MANTVKMKRSSVAGKVPATADLELGELAVNTHDGKLYMKRDVSGVESIVDVTAGGPHIHAIADVTGLQTALDGKAVTSHTHANATTSAAGFMSSADKTKLDGVATGANNYSHPTGDGNLHVPATGTINNGKVLKAGSTAGSLSWGTLTASDVGAATSSHNHDASYPTLAAFNALANRVAALENIIANGAVHWDGKLALR